MKPESLRAVESQTRFHDGRGSKSKRSQSGLSEGRAAVGEGYRGGGRIAVGDIHHVPEANPRHALDRQQNGGALRRLAATRRWEEVEAALRREYQDRVKETVDAVEKAVAANLRLQEVQREAEELVPEDEVRRGALCFELCWPELNRERLEGWLHFLSLTGLFDKREPHNQK